MSMRKRISDEMLDKLIENEGTVDGLVVPNATGVLRLALDLRDARRELARVEKLHASMHPEAVRTITCPDCGRIVPKSRAVTQCDDHGRPEDVCESCSSVRDTNAGVFS